MAPEINESIGRQSGVVSLYTLMKFETNFFMELANVLRELEAFSYLAEPLDIEELPVQHKSRIALTCAALGRLCEFHDWLITSRKAKRICESLMNGELTSPMEASRQLRELRERLDDELKDQYFIHLNPRDVKHYSFPETGWEAIMDRFPEVRHNVIETHKCLALERYGAAVFHILLVAEYGVIQLGNLMKVSGDKPGWSSLDRLVKRISEPFEKRDLDTQKHTALLENTIPLTKVMKDSWRHKLMHVDNQIVWQDTDFSREVAEEIITATRGFMRKLASELPK